MELAKRLGQKVNKIVTGVEEAMQSDVQIESEKKILISSSLLPALPIAEALQNGARKELAIEGIREEIHNTLKKGVMTPSVKQDSKRIREQENTPAHVYQG